MGDRVRVRVGEREAAGLRVTGRFMEDGDGGRVSNGPGENSNCSS